MIAKTCAKLICRVRRESLQEQHQQQHSSSIPVYTIYCVAYTPPHLISVHVLSIFSIINNNYHTTSHHDHQQIPHQHTHQRDIIITNMISLPKTTMMPYVFILLLTLLALFIPTTTAEWHTHASALSATDDTIHLWGQYVETTGANTAMLDRIIFEINHPNVFLTKVVLTVRCAATGCNGHSSNMFIFDHHSFETTSTATSPSQITATLPTPIYILNTALRYDFAVTIGRLDETIGYDDVVLRQHWLYDNTNDHVYDTTIHPEYPNNIRALAAVSKNQRGLVANVAKAEWDENQRREQFSHVLHIPTIYNPQHAPIHEIKVELAASAWDYVNRPGHKCLINGEEWGNVMFEAWSVSDSTYFRIESHTTPLPHHNHLMPMRIECPTIRFYPIQSGYVSDTIYTGRVAVQLFNVELNPESNDVTRKTTIDAVLSPPLAVKVRGPQGSSIVPTPHIKSAVHLLLQKQEQQQKEQKEEAFQATTTLFWFGDKVDQLKDVTFHAVFTNAFQPTSSRGEVAYNTLSVAIPDLNSHWLAFSSSYHPNAAPTQHAAQFKNNVIHYTTGLQWTNDTTISFKAVDAFKTVYTSTTDVRQLFLTLTANVIQPIDLPRAKDITVTWYYTAPCGTPYNGDKFNEECTYLAPTFRNDLLQPNTPQVAVPTTPTIQQPLTLANAHKGIVLGAEVTKNLIQNITTTTKSLKLTITTPGSMVFTLPILSSTLNAITTKHCSYWNSAHGVAGALGNVTMVDLLEPMNGGALQPFRQLVVEFDATPPLHWVGEVRCAAIDLVQVWGTNDKVLEKTVTGGQYMVRWEVPTEQTTTKQYYTTTGIANVWHQDEPHKEHHTARKVLLVVVIILLLVVVGFFVYRHFQKTRKMGDHTQPIIPTDQYDPPSYKEFD